LFAAAWIRIVPRRTYTFRLRPGIRYSTGALVQNGNTAGFCNKHIDAEIARALQTGDPPAASRLCCPHFVPI
jgi:hypothetical protein